MSHAANDRQAPANRRERRAAEKKAAVSAKRAKYLRRTTNRYARTFYEVRRQSGFLHWGFSVPLPLDVSRDDLHDMTICVPMQWSVLAIAYFRNPDGGKEYLDSVEIRTDQAFTAVGQGIVPFLEAAMEAAEARGNPNHLVDRVTIMKPWAKGSPGMAPILYRHQHDLDLTDQAIEDIINAE